MHERALRNVDLNLLLAFSVLMRERNVSRAAKCLAIGQSGMSGALARLRVLLDDPVLVRVGRRLEPTPRALALVDAVDASLGRLVQALGAAAPFDPCTAARTFTLGLSDDHELLFAGPLAEALLAEAPRARLVLRPVDVYSVRRALDDDGLDAVVSSIRELPSWHEAVPLFSQGYACVWSRRQLPGLSRLTLRRYVAHAHALVSFRGDLTSLVDDALAALGVQRRVVVGVARFSALPAVLGAQPLLCTVPAPLARRFACEPGLATAPPPFELEARCVRLVYRVHDGGLPELAWFRGLVARTLRVDGALAPARAARRRVG